MLTIVQYVCVCVCLCEGSEYLGGYFNMATPVGV